jgi:hypothetical protein
MAPAPIPPTRGKAGVNSVTLCRHSCTASMPHPSREDSETLERGTDFNPAPARDGAVTSDQWSASPTSSLALCGHPRQCATIPGTAAPSSVLWEPGTTRHCHTYSCASSGLPSAAPSSQHTDCDQNEKLPHSCP